jgi:hypothetical protein
MPDEPGLSRPEAAKYLGLSVNTLRNYHRGEKLVPTWSAERGRWEYPLGMLDQFVAANVLLTAKGERPSVRAPEQQPPPC